MRMTTLTMTDLMADPIYRAYMKKAPATPSSLTGKPWRLWVKAPEGRWLTGEFSTYRDVWPVFVKNYRSGTADPTIVAKNRFFAPPGEWYKVRVRVNPTLKYPTGFKIEDRWRQTYFWADPRLGWCGRCRRPVYWAPLTTAHHALRRFPVVSDEDNVRCPICGIRKSAQPSIDQMEKSDA